MTLELHRTDPAELDAVTKLLVSVFNSPPDAAFVDRGLLRWKYFDCGPSGKVREVTFCVRKAKYMHIVLSGRLIFTSLARR